ncbi:hypothetical protein [Kribbella sp. NPDC055071]
MNGHHDEELDPEPNALELDDFPEAVIFDDESPQGADLMADEVAGVLASQADPGTPDADAEVG